MKKRALMFITALFILATTSLSFGAEANKKISGNDSTNVIHIVRHGQTLSLISWRYKWPIPEILADNPSITNIHRIEVGKKIVITAPKIAKKIAKKNMRKNAKLVVRKKAVVKNQYAVLNPCDFNRTYNYPADKISHATKVRLLKKVERKWRVNWMDLAGISKVESDFGFKLVGDGGDSRGAFHINLPSHPGVTIEQANDFYFSADYAAKYLVNDCGYRNGKFNAFRRYNGGPKNGTVIPSTKTYAKAVMRHAKSFGYTEENTRVASL